MKKTPTLLLALLMLSALFSCTKKRPYHNVNAELKAKYSFKPGSYWIFVDSATGNTDSYYVKHNFTATDKEYTYDYESVETYFQPYSLRNTEDQLFAILLAENYLSIKYVSSPQNNNIGGSVQYPFYDRPSATDPIKIFDSYHVINNDFNNTVMISFHSGDSYWLTEEAGIVKVNFMDGVYPHKVLKLLRWHIER